MFSVQRRLLIVVLAITRRPRLTLAILIVILAGCSILAATRLTISTDQNKLFSNKVPFFRHYLDYISKFRENEAIYIVLEPKKPTDHPALARWTGAADEISAALRGLTTQVRNAYAGIPLAELGSQGILFEDPKKLPAELSDAKDQLVPLAKFWGQAPSVGEELLGRTPIERLITGVTVKNDAQTAQFIGLLAESWTRAVSDPNLPMRVGQGVVDFKSLSAKDPLQLGYFYVPDEMDRSRYRILIRVYPKRHFDSLTAITQTVDAIRDTAEAAVRKYPEFSIGVTGRPALEADEMRTTDADSHRAEIAALIAVFIGMAIMLRSIWLAVAAEIALGFGIGWTFGWSTVTLGQLNLLSLVFLIALIGIGMDYLVQILTRYRLEARRYQRPSAVWVRVFRHVGPPINTACLGAAGAFLVSVFTDFRGAADLGIIAGGGLILCLIAGYTVLPAILTIFPPKLSPLPLGKRYRRPKRFGSVRRILLPLMWAVLLAAGSPFISRTHFDPNLIGLQVPTLTSVKLIRTLQTWMAVVLSRDVNQLAAIRDKVAPLAEVASTESMLNAKVNADYLKANAEMLPEIQWADPTPVSSKDLPRIAAKARSLADHFAADGKDDAHQHATAMLRAFSAALLAGGDAGAVRAAERLSEWQTVFVDELHGLLEQFHPQPLNLSALPEALRSHLVSPDGFYALYIYPKKDLWERANLAAFETAVENAVATVPNAPPVTGISSNVYHTTQSIHDAFFQATVYALIWIVLLVFLDFRNVWHTLAAVSVLAMGLPMLVSIMGMTGANWNFANFFGLPILIGAGHEYGVFMVHRYLEARKHARRVWGRWDVSDRALLLCAFITSSSFGFFWWLAQHQGLKSLGLVMTIGTACIYLSAVMVLRPLLKWRLEKMHPPIEMDESGT